MSVHVLIAALVIPPVLLGIFSLLVVRKNLGPAYAVRNSAKRSGADVAKWILSKQFPVDTCRVAHFEGRSFDHYSPNSHCLGLHIGHYADNTVAAVAVAAQQAAMAELCEKEVFGARTRQSFVPLTVFTAQVLPMGIFFDVIWDEVAYLGVLLAACYLFLAFFQLASLRLEAMAGKRAIAYLEEMNFLTDAEMALAKQAMDGIVWTYPASLFSSWLNLHHNLVRLGYNPPKPPLPAIGTVRRVRPQALGVELNSKS